jgi:hypothetical protein
VSASTPRRRSTVTSREEKIVTTAAPEGGDIPESIDKLVAGGKGGPFVCGAARMNMRTAPVDALSRCYLARPCQREKGLPISLGLQ